MTAKTPRYGLRHPERTDPAEAWTAFGQLADDTETALGGVDDRLATGESALGSLRDRLNTLNSGFETNQVAVSFSNKDNHTVAVTFAKPFKAQPVVFTNIHSGAGPTARWVSRAINITEQGFTMFVFATVPGRTATWSRISCHWVAILHD